MKSLQDKDLAYTYLSTLSPKDKSWDVRKAQSKKIGHLYQDTILDKYAHRIDNCSGFLGFKWAIDSEAGELTLKLNAARFCRVRQCPICQWRRSLMWVARFLKALPAITQDYPSARYIFLTLTVKNCQVQELKETLAWMNKAWQRLAQRKSFPAIGFARSTEITRGQDDSVHPHFHALLMVDPGYFAGKNYLSQADWTEIWKSCLRVDYTPIVHVRAVKNRRRQRKEQNMMDSSSESLSLLQGVSSGIVETFKYSLKPSDLLGTGSEADRQWLVDLTFQLNNSRSIALGGIFKDYLSEKEPENLISENDDQEIDKISDLSFGWRELVKRYTHIKEESA